MIEWLRQKLDRERSVRKKWLGRDYSRVLFWRKPFQECFKLRIRILSHTSRCDLTLLSRPDKTNMGVEWNQKTQLDLVQNDRLNEIKGEGSILPQFSNADIDQPNRRSPPTCHIYLWLVLVRTYERISTSGSVSALHVPNPGDCPTAAMLIQFPQNKITPCHSHVWLMPVR